MTNIRWAVALVVAAASVVALDAQKMTQLKVGGGGSPHVRTDWTIDGANISIEYGRPSLKGRPEPSLMPPGRVWRLGADEQTTLKVDKALKFGSLAVPAGTYGLHALPGAGEWQLIISKRQTGWGIPYPEGQDLGRVSMKVGKAAAAAEQLTISIDDSAAGASLRIEWGTTSATTPFTVG